MLSTLRGTVFLLIQTGTYFLTRSRKEKREDDALCTPPNIPFLYTVDNRTSVLNGRVIWDKEYKQIRMWTFKSLPGISHTISFIFYIIFWLLFLKPDILLCCFTFLICKYTVRKGVFLELFFFLCLIQLKLSYLSHAWWQTDFLGVFSKLPQKGSTQ